MKALGMLQKWNNGNYPSKQEISEAIAELEALENRSCENCVYYLSDNGNYPLEPCGECSRWYADRWESK